MPQPSFENPFALPNVIMKETPRPRRTMKKADSIPQVLSRHLSVSGRTIVDVGCGAGDLVRWLTGRGARAIGIDRPDVLARTRALERSGDEIYLPGAAERLPLSSDLADGLVYAASLHHVPPDSLNAALGECYRVLKDGGRAVFIEPVARPGAYTEITRLTGDETEVQRMAHAAILRAAGAGMEMRIEEMFYLERSFEDFEAMIRFAVPDESERARILREARSITERMALAAGVPFEDFRYRSICRLNILLK